MPATRRAEETVPYGANVKEVALRFCRERPTTQVTPDHAPLNPWFF
jgi:hypothetical protein